MNEKEINYRSNRKIRLTANHITLQNSTIHFSCKLFAFQTSLQTFMDNRIYLVAATGGYRYENGSVYVGTWNNDGKRHGEGHLKFPDGTRYDGDFEEGVFHGLGVLTFPDGAKYEGEFFQGWFHGHGVFWRADGMRHEGEFRGGRIWGLGLTTFSDDTNGFPRNEGFFQDCQLKKLMKCPEDVQKAQKMAFMARNQFVTNSDM